MLCQKTESVREEWEVSVRGVRGVRGVRELDALPSGDWRLARLLKESLHTGQGYQQTRAISNSITHIQSGRTLIMWLCKHWCLAPPLMQVVQIKYICIPAQLQVLANTDPHLVQWVITPARFIQGVVVCSKDTSSFIWSNGLLHELVPGQVPITKVKLQKQAGGLNCNRWRLTH